MNRLRGSFHEADGRMEVWARMTGVVPCWFDGSRGSEGPGEVPVVAGTKDPCVGAPGPPMATVGPYVGGEGCT
jgi:hypothetical protein